MHWHLKPKLITLTLILFIMALEKHLILIACYGLSILLLHFIQKVPWRKTAKIIMTMIPFLIFMTLPLLVNSGFDFKDESTLMALSIVLKSILSVLLMRIATYGHPLHEIILILNELKLPQPIVHIFFLSTRYIFVIQKIILDLLTALKARNFKMKLNFFSLKVYGQIIGGMLVKSMEYGHKVNQAMIARGFNGALNTEILEQAQKKDFLFSASCFLWLLFLKGGFFYVQH